NLKKNSDDEIPKKPAETKSKLGVVFWTSSTIILAAAIVAILIPARFQVASASVYGWISNYFSWFFMIAVFGFGVGLIFLALAASGRVQLGGERCQPEFSFRSWMGMVFSAGLGVGLVCFGVAEPMSDYMISPFTGGPVEDEDAAKMAMG